MATQSGTQTVARAIQLLKMFDDDHPQWSLAELVRAMDINKTTLFRLLAALETEGLVRRTPSGNYRLGSEMIALGGRAMRANDLRLISHDPLRHLARETGETTTLEVLRQDRHGLWTTLVIDEVLGSHLVGITQYIGSRLPVHATSSGKVLLAYQTPEMIRTILDQPLTDLTNHTVVAPEVLLRELETIREQGAATAIGELEMGVVAAAAPIFDHNGEVQAAISVVGPSIRVNQAALGRLAAQVKDTAGQVSHQLGFRHNGVL